MAQPAVDASRASTDSHHDTNGSTPSTAGAGRRTGRWRGIVAVILVAVSVGVLAKRPALLLVGAVGVAFAAYPHLIDPPQINLAVTRQLTPESPDADDDVTVETTVKNTGEMPLFDLRLIDGVPPMAAVTDGSPRSATALRPGETTTLEYTIDIDRTTHRFRPLTAIARDPSGATEVERTIEEETTIEGASRIPDVPLRSQSRRQAGRLITDDGGSGIEFHRTRQYERGDPVNRINWRQFARTGELSSIDFREERVAEVVVCVDTRRAAFRAASPSDPHAVAYANGCAGRLTEALLDAHHLVGLAAFGRELCWLPPAAGNNQESRIHRYLAAHPAFDVIPPEHTATSTASGTAPTSFDAARESLATSLRGNGTYPPTDASIEQQLSTIRAQLSGQTQVILVTPLNDDEASRIAQLLEQAGSAVTVVSVDVTTDDTVGGRFARVERENRIHALRNAGIPIVDWEPTDRLGTAMALAGRAKS